MKLFLDARPVPGGIARATNAWIDRLREALPEGNLLLYGAGQGASGAAIPLGEGLSDRRPAHSSPDLGRHDPRLSTAPTETHESSTPDGLEPPRTPSLRAALGDVKRILEERLWLPWRVRRARPDVFLSPNGCVPPGLSCRTVVQCHDAWLIDRPETKKPRLVTRYERWTLLTSLRRADLVLTPSRSARDDLVARLPWLEGRTAHLYNPPSTVFDGEPGAGPRPASSEHLDDAGRYLLCVGTLEPRKNLERLIAAQRRLWPSTRIPLVLVGSYGWSQEALLEAIRDSDGAVRWAGPLPDRELAGLYRGAAAVVQVSVAEGFSYPAVEAMQAGVPLVLSDLPVHREIAGDGPCYCPAESVEAIARALEDVLTWTAERRDAWRSICLERVARLDSGSRASALLALLDAGPEAEYR